ncbi:MAG: hypothetical protein JXR37_08175 [Kiritimatiellae bacterium]|nr:hypothetical protein [Kiritimatiellia bacterium]
MRAELSREIWVVVFAIVIAGHGAACGQAAMEFEAQEPIPGLRDSIFDGHMGEQGKTAIDLHIEMNMSEGQMFEPTSLAVDVTRQLLDQAVLGIVHTMPPDADTWVLAGSPR